MIKSQSVYSIIAASLCMLPLTVSADVSCSGLSHAVQPTTPSTHFIDHQDGTLTHKVSGLMWRRCLNGSEWREDLQSCDNEGTEQSWRMHLEYAGQAAYAEHDDWRLPNLVELMSIVEASCGQPSLNRQLFGVEGAHVVLFSASPAQYGQVQVVTLQQGGFDNWNASSTLRAILVRNAR